MTRGLSLKTSMILGIVGVTVIVALLYAFDVHRDIVHLLEWMNRQGPAAGAIFVALMATAVVVLAPGVFFTTGAGFVFGVVMGSIYVIVGTALGSIAAFVIARRGFGEKATAYVRSHAKIRLIDAEVSHQGWKLVMLTRLVPLFPFKVSNYLFGLSRFSLKDFAIGNTIGILPYSVHNVYVGSLAADALSVSAGVAQRSPWQWAMYLGGFAALAVFLVYLNRMAKRILATYELQRRDAPQVPRATHVSPVNEGEERCRG
ncbi:TVP38/TMEM64 family protein [Hahella sp. KA22]|uniref:TVP38/TMEM64 family protein n=1 Tax=Hahella sp. KA22 TaxID=1628392 RepID=UPI000FDD14DE|nr:TVP38/TMEM64 family protein [Hahella sp. KA22]AZZ92002.1 TVP38/TMEM64 family protein [Hahella sp. KA22]QAY55373.1 TVP38/TMEM64 family protein [Hahella sp. KA22]